MDAVYLTSNNSLQMKSNVKVFILGNQNVSFGLTLNKSGDKSLVSENVLHVLFLKAFQLITERLIRPTRHAKLY